MNLFFDFIFDTVVEILSSVVDKLGKNRPEHATNGTMAECILIIGVSCALTGYGVLRLLCGDDYGRTGMRFLGIFLLVLATVLVGAVLLRYIVRGRRNRRDSQDESR